MFQFTEILGNEKVIVHLRNAIINRNASHAYIIEGQPGIGKKLLAKSFAKALQCERGKADPCNECASCRTFESGNHPDVIYVTPSKTRSIGVDDAREQINRNMEIKPYRHNYKIFIVDNADTMTAAAQNALLKTIEEPAPYGVFLLLAVNRNSLLPTILSRCVLLSLKPLSDDRVKHYLTSRGISESQAAIAGVYAQGNIGRALRLADNEDFNTMRCQILQVLQNIETMDMINVFSLFPVFEQWKDSMQEALDIMYLWYRDIIVVKETGSDRFLLQVDQKEEIGRTAAAVSFSSLYQKIEAVWLAKKQLKWNGNFQMTMEALIMKLSCA